MPVKHFLVNPKVESQDKTVLNEVREYKERIFRDTHFEKRKKDEETLAEKDKMRYVQGRVVVKVDIDGKDSWTFENGNKIEYKRRFNNLNVRETNPVNAIVISGEGINEGAEILVHPNAVHDSNRIFDYKDGNDNIRYYSIHNDMCFAWHDGKEWLPLPPYDFGLRVFQPYGGLISGIAPKLLTDTLYVTTGELKGKVVKTVKAADYEIVFQDKNGREGNLIRFRPFGAKDREEEAIAILEDLTDKVSGGEFLIGLYPRDAKKINEII